MHKFQLWSLSKDPLEKLTLYFGFTNGLFMGPRLTEFIALANCLENNTTSDQAIAIIDKSYKDNPQRWSMPFGQEVVLALTVKDFGRGLCEQSCFGRGNSDGIG
jgi:hypothetical protein